MAGLRLLIGPAAARRVREAVRPWRRRLPRPGGRPSAGAALGLAGALAVGLTLLFRLSLPDPLFRRPFSTVLLDREGTLLSATPAADGQWRFPGDRELPRKFVQALVAFEDRRFRLHRGVDPAAVLRATLTNLRRGRTVSGASTLTMQVIRLSRPGRSRTAREKLVEMTLALQLELVMPKERILRLFASHAPFGGNVVGLEAASWRYFGRDPADLSWAESCLLAVLPNSPGLIHPGRNREALRARRDRLLEVLRGQGALTEREYRLARAEPLPAQPHPIPREAPHLLFRVQREGAARVPTTLDGRLQERANTILRRHLAEWRPQGVRNGAALIVELASGAVLAYVGNDPDPVETMEGAFVDLVPAPRSTGSLLKPFLYAAMLDAGELLPSQLVPDVPTRLGGFIPENSTKTFQGAVRADEFLARSLNVPAVRLLASYGVERFAVFLRGAGMSTLFRPAMDYGLTLVLGGAEGTLWELTGMYAGLGRSAAGGKIFPPHFRLSGEAAGAPEAPSLSPAAAWLTLNALVEVERPGEEGAWRDYLGAKKIAWKTGTSYGFRDAWAIGVTPGYAVGVWVGNAIGEGRPDLRGSAYAAPVLFELFGLLPDTGWFPPPARHLQPVQVCSRSGFLLGPQCAQGALAFVPERGLASRPCPYCRLVHLDPEGRFQVSSHTERVDRIRSEPWFVLPPGMEWFYRRSHLDYRPLPPFRPAAGRDLAAVARIPAITLLAPERGSSLYIPVELDGEPGRTVFQAAHRDPRATVYWHLDGEYLGQTTELHNVEARPGPGPHRLTLLDGDGEECSVTFRVLSGQ